MRDISLLILGAALGWISQWLFYRFQQRDTERQGPKLVTSKVTQHGRVMFEIRNIGTDSLSEMDVNIIWLEHQQRKTETLKQFFLPDQEVQSANQKHVELIGPGERYVLGWLPQSTDDGLVNVEILGFGVQSHRPYKFDSQIVVGLLPV